MSEDVTNFLKQVRELGDRSIEEGEVRSRQLEEKILQQKRERQARRADRARSISPQKSSTSNPYERSNTLCESASFLALSPDPERPSSSMSEVDVRTIETGTRWSRLASPPNETESPFRSKPEQCGIADGSQPAGSAMPWQLRRPQVEDADRHGKLVTQTESPTKSGYPSPEPHEAEILPASGSQCAVTSAPLLCPLRKEVPLSGLSLQPATIRDDVPPSAASTLGYTSPTRPESPTKGMGGFVQSAMMKRSDSVSKRCSVNSPPVVTRAGSSASSQQSRDLSRVHGLTLSVSPSLGDKSTQSPNPPGNLSNSLIHSQSQENDSGKYRQNTSANIPTIGSEAAGSEAAGEEPHLCVQDKLPASPSKIVDSRRWSPTKASWLESALNKPESPKRTLPPPVPRQPLWMVQLNEAKAQKASRPGADLDIPASTTSHEHSIGAGGLALPPSGSNTKPPTLHGSGEMMPTPTTHTQTTVSSLRGNSKVVPPSSVFIQAETRAMGSAFTYKPKAPPKKDFRANLKTRPAGVSARSLESKDSTDEFKSVFGNLRPTVTQKQVPVDEFKSDLLRGKAALTITGGPKEAERKDEFKEAIIRKRKEIKKARLEGNSTKRSPGVGSRTTQPNVPSSRKDSPGEDYKASRETQTGDLQNPGAAESTAAEAGSGLLQSKTSAPSEESALPHADSPVATPHKKKLRDPPKSSRKELNAPGPVLENTAPSVARDAKAGSDSMTDQFRPALAGLLVRRPPAPSGHYSCRPGSPQTASTSNTEIAGPQLIHMTKHRARGPQRKLPSSTSCGRRQVLSSTSSNPSKPHHGTDALEPPRTSRPSGPETTERTVPTNAAQVYTPFAPTGVAQFHNPIEQSNAGAAEMIRRRKVLADDLLGTFASPETKPPGHSQEAAQICMATIHEQVAIAAAAKKGQPPPRRLLEEKRHEKMVHPPSPKKLDASRMFRFDKPGVEPREATGSFIQGSQ